MRLVRGRKAGTCKIVASHSREEAAPRVWNGWKKRNLGVELPFAVKLTRIATDSILLSSLALFYSDFVSLFCSEGGVILYSYYFSREPSQPGIC